MDEKKYSVIAKNISKGYKMYSSPKQKLLDLILPKGAGKTFYALKDISFKIEKGEVVGLLGLNGSGKSTLSNILGGVSMPTTGEIEINGEAALIAISLGMNNFLTGIENIELKAIMMGYKKSEIEEIKQEIIDFADIGEFINQPLRTYSSGMRSRLGFAISIYTNPDILVIDEALSVGDPTFTQKCLDKMNEFKESGKTIFFVSHSLSQIKKFCNKAIWLEYGSLKEYGDVEVVLPKYQEYINEINKMTDKERDEYRKNILKNQDHSLLKEFKFIDKNLKKFNPKGKLIKKVLLINDKNKIKDVFFNIDITTLAFGFIPSIIRKRYETALFILLAQVLNFFIIGFPFSLFTNFIITGIASIFTAKSYLDYLIENEKFIPYTIWKKENLEDGNIKKQISFNNKVKKSLVLISILYILINSIVSFGYMYKNVIANLITSNDRQMKVNNYAIVTLKEENIESLLILNSKDAKSLDGIVYPGKIQVKSKNKIDELNKLITVDDMDKLKGIIKKNFYVEISDYVVINKNDIDNDSSNDYVNLYKNMISNILNLDENTLKSKANEIGEKYSNIDKELVEEFYNNFKGKKINISNAKYDVVKLGDIIENEVLEALNSAYKENYEFITIDKRLLQSNELVKSINDKYNKYLENKELEENVDNEIEEPLLNNDYNSGGSNQENQETIVPPNNNEETGGNLIPPTNNEGGNIQSPGTGEGESGNIQTPGTGEGRGENTESPGTGEGGGENTESPGTGEGGGGNTESPGTGEGGGGNTEPPETGEGESGNTESPGTGEGEGGNLN